MKVLGQIMLWLFMNLMASWGWTAPSHIIILRHGEKVSDEERNLSEKGYARAEALADYFSNPRFLSVYGKPALFFAASPAKKSSLRSVETVEPAARKLAVPLDTSFKKNDAEKLMAYVQANKEFDGRTVVICWNHSGIPDLLSSLEGDFPKKWGDRIFDRFWVLDLLSDGSYAFKSIPQDLLPGDEPSPSLAEY